MSEALYRIYRPQTFKDVVGQNHIVSVLESAIQDGTLAHAYLFSGSRGLGKTSIARIFAQTLGITPSDIYEIDAASNRSVDDARALREGVATLPFESEYKVYIIDEAHMLTKEAFNTLLKTLEEPPSHVIFILATTELHKVPDTIVSRCQTFSFKKPTRTVLRDMLIAVAKKEGRVLEAPAGELVALMGDGSYRDALGVLQKVITGSTEKKITRDIVAECIGAPKSELVNDILLSLHTGNPEKGIQAIQDARTHGFSMDVLLSLLLAKIRAVLLLRHAKQMEQSLAEDFSEDDMILLKGYADDNDSCIQGRSLVAFLEAHAFLNTTDIAGLPLELALIKLSEKTKIA